MDGTIINTSTNKILKGNNTTQGYLTIDTYPFGYNGKHVRLYIHRLVALKYVPLPSGFTHDKFDVNHKDGNKQNNHYTNLEWATRQENVLHAYRNNLAQQHSYKVNIYKNDKKLTFNSYKEVADFLNVKIHCIRDRLSPKGKNIPLNGFILEKIE
jgi:hypothetical protein